MRAVILMLALRASPACFSESSVLSVLTAPLPAGERAVVLHSESGSLQARWLHDAGRDHLALLGPMGHPVVVLRSDGERVSVQQLGRPELVAQAGRALQILEAPALADLGRLMQGRVPEDTVLTRTAHGWSSLHADFDRRGVLQRAEVEGVRWEHGVLTWERWSLGLEIGPLQPREVPVEAFEISDQAVPVEVLAAAAAEALEGRL